MTNVKSPNIAFQRANVHADTLSTPWPDVCDEKLTEMVVDWNKDKRPESEPVLSGLPHASLGILFYLNDKI
jgi:hypothetical protein